MTTAHTALPSLRRRRRRRRVETGRRGVMPGVWACGLLWLWPYSSPGSRGSHAGRRSVARAHTWPGRRAGSVGTNAPVPVSRRCASWPCAPRAHRPPLYFAQECGPLLQKSAAPPCAAGAQPGAQQCSVVSALLLLLLLLKPLGVDGRIVGSRQGQRRGRGRGAKHAAAFIITLAFSHCIVWTLEEGQVGPVASWTTDV